MPLLILFFIPFFRAASIGFTKLGLPSGQKRHQYEKGEKNENNVSLWELSTEQIKFLSVCNSAAPPPPELKKREINTKICAANFGVYLPL
jgi:hypothetical protein